MGPSGPGVEQAQGRLRSRRVVLDLGQQTREGTPVALDRGVGQARAVGDRARRRRARPIGGPFGPAGPRVSEV